MTTPPHSLTRTVLIDAHPETVFGFFQDSARWAAWWGPGSTIDPRPGGRVLIRYPNAIEVTGDILEIAPPHRIVFTYGFVSGQPVPPGGSLVTIELARAGAGTRLTLTHAFDDAPARDQHVQGWRYQLSVFANVVANHLHGNIAELADAWFAAWAEPDDTRRRSAFETIATADVSFGDRYSALIGTEEVAIHAGAAQKFMPGISMRRDGEPRHCLGTALVDWIATRADGTTMSTGTNVIVLDRDNRIRAVTGIWG
jgi:uncharacterized protein YndB with AHSA1/START domain